MSAVGQLAPHVGIAQACQALGVPRSSYYRARQPQATPAPRPAPARALAPQEREEVRAGPESRVLYLRVPAIVVYAVRVTWTWRKPICSTFSPRSP